MSWKYTSVDAGISLFTAALQAGAPMAFSPGMRILEVGCCESDWLVRASETWPECAFIGIDVNTKETQAGNRRQRRANVLHQGLFDPGSFDAVVSLSALEHVGLGHYRDPVDADGDTKALANIWHWLKPGGWLYFDVPYDPTGYRVLNTECRIYDDASLWERLWQTPLVQAKASAQYLWTGYVDSRFPGTLLPEKPTVPAPRYWYVANVWKKQW